MLNNKRYRQNLYVFYKDRTDEIAKAWMQEYKEYNKAWWKNYRQQEKEKVLFSETNCKKLRNAIDWTKTFLAIPPYVSPNCYDKTLSPFWQAINQIAT